MAFPGINALIGLQVPKLNGAIVGPTRQQILLGMERNGADPMAMTRQCLLTLARAEIPKFDALIGTAAGQ